MGISLHPSPSTERERSKNKSKSDPLVCPNVFWGNLKCKMMLKPIYQYGPACWILNCHGNHLTFCEKGTRNLSRRFHLKESHDFWILRLSR
jgi:hypothetical protein